uniref:THAP-type domain-containing protein n=1 Tax=Lygus hesperus TaxID=30085 RepID=A0A0K8SD77_LYGHE
MRCCVPFCEEDSPIHKFPTANEKQCQVWLARIGNGELVQKEMDEFKERFGICDSHFEQRCHDTDTDDLISGALPTLLLPGSRSDEYFGSYSMDFLPDSIESPEALDMIVEGISDSSHLVNVHIDSEVEDVARRYNTSQTEKIRDESEITIHRPEDIEIVTRYATKCEQDSDDEIILKYPNDDDVVKRYSASVGLGSVSRRVGVCDKGSSTEHVILEECADGFEVMNRSASISGVAGCKPSSGNQIETSDFQVRRLLLESYQSPIRTQSSSNTHESDSEMSDSIEGSMLDHGVSEHPSDDEEGGIHRDPGELNSVSEEFEDSCYDSVDADEALRALMKPGCSSPRNHSITVYNLCCDKKFLSRSPLTHQRKICYQLVERLAIEIFFRTW